MEDQKCLEDFKKFALKSEKEINFDEFILYSKSLQCKTQLDNIAKNIFHKVSKPDSKILIHTEFAEARKRLLTACEEENKLCSQDEDDGGLFA